MKHLYRAAAITDGAFAKFHRVMLFCYTNAAIEAFVSVRLLILWSSNTLLRIKEPLDIFMPICCLGLTHGSAAEREETSDHIRFMSHRRSRQSHLFGLFALRWICIATSGAGVRRALTIPVHRSLYLSSVPLIILYW